MVSPSDTDYARKLIGCLDLTELSDDRSADKVDALLEKARTSHGHVAAVCVWPDHVRRCARALKGSHVQIATVVNFPTGQAPWDEVRHEVRLALADGATEIDMVVDYEKGVEDPHSVTYGVKHVREAAGGLPVKAILETGALDDTDDMQLLAGAALSGGASFVKTSTGKIRKGATPEAAQALLEAIAAAGTGGLKVSGGVRTFADARLYAQLAAKEMGTDWLTPKHFRIGASSLFDDLVTVADGGMSVGGAAAGY